MRFNTKAEALYYIATHSQRYQRCLHIIATRHWNHVVEDWEKCWSVVFIPNKTGPRHRSKVLA